MKHFFCCRRRRSLPALSTERRGQPATCPCESRHDGADRHFCCLGNLAVIQAFDVAQHQCFPERRRQRRNCGAELIGVDLGEEGCLWRLQIRIGWVGLRKLDRF